MQNDKEIFDMLKDMYPQHPSQKFVTSTENTLRQQARSMSKKRLITRFSVMTSGFLVCAFIFSWLILYSENSEVSVEINGYGATSSNAIDENEPVVYIYHSHNTESFIPEHQTKKSNQMFSHTKNVTLVGKELSKALKKLQIKA